MAQPAISVAAPVDADATDFVMQTLGECAVLWALTPRARSFLDAMQSGTTRVNGNGIVIDHGWPVSMQILRDEGYTVQTQ